MTTTRRDFRNRLIILLAGLTTILALGGWLVWSEPSVFRWLLRLYTDREFMHQILQRYGVLAPLVFIAIQALQVIIAPIPGDVTGVLGGFAFGQWLGFLYSTIGLTIGSLFAFWLGRRLGAPIVARVTGPEVWQRLDFVVEAEGAIFCFIIFLVPGLPKDTLCYLFGVSPIPFWVFAVVSTLGRMPGTWVLSAGGAKAAAAQRAPSSCFCRCNAERHSRFAPVLRARAAADMWGGLADRCCRGTRPRVVERLVRDSHQMARLDALVVFPGALGIQNGRR